MQQDLKVTITEVDSNIEAGKLERLSVSLHSLALFRTQNFGRWVRRGGGAVADQGIFALSHFLLNVLLARWLAPVEYGAFTIAFTTFLLVGTFHSALVVEPLLVLSPGRYRHCQADYFRVLQYGHWGFSVFCGLFLLLAGLGFRNADLGVLASAMVGAAVASPFILFQWLMRRVCYVGPGPHLGAVGGSLYGFLLLVGIASLYSRGWLSGMSALVVMGLSSLLVGLWLKTQMPFNQATPADREMFGQALRDHWNYGRWAVATGVLTWIPGQVYYLLLPAWGGLATSGAFKALMNLILPLLHIQTALAVLLVPTLVQAHTPGQFTSRLRHALLLFTAGALLYGLALGLFYRHVLAWFYGGSYQEYGAALWILGGSLPLAGMVDVLGAALRARERPDQVFWAYLFSTVTALTVGLGCITAWGVVGAGMGFFLSTAVKVLTMGVSYRRSAATEIGKEG